MCMSRIFLSGIYDSRLKRGAGSYICISSLRVSGKGAGQGGESRGAPRRLLSWIHACMGRSGNE